MKTSEKLKAVKVSKLQSRHLEKTAGRGLLPTLSNPVSTALHSDESAGISSSTVMIQVLLTLVKAKYINKYTFA